MYLLGVDGGGTKLDFLLTDLDCKPIFQFKYDCNSNLKYCGGAKLIEYLADGLDKIAKQIDLKQIKFTYLGIAECGNHCEIAGRQEVFDYLTTKLNRFELGDDQYSVFRSKSNSKHGVLANAGTGSNINYFHKSKSNKFIEQTFKSLGEGGRDLGRTILDLIIGGQIAEDTQIYKFTKKSLEMSPIEFYNSISQVELIKNYKVSQIPKTLVENCTNHPYLRKEMEFYSVFTASRWITKINGKCVNNFNIPVEQSFDLVMAGSLWKWGSMREKVIIGISKLYPNVNFCFDSEKKPVEGCIMIAKEMI